jgi:16S rRNA (uracil1498-N3)-methyltransferase
MRRFLVEGVTEGSQVVLPTDEGLHAIRSLRMGPGDDLVVFDGAGAEYDATIVRIQSARVLVSVGAKRAVRAGRRVAIATAVPKGNRLDWMVEKLAEVGASEIVPVAFKRSVASIGAAKKARLERIAAAAAKQSGRADLPSIADEIGFDALLPRIGADSWVASPGGGKPAAPAGLVVIGPEGGLTDEEERRLVAKGARRVSLGDQILRIETAALVAAALAANA